MQIHCVFTKFFSSASKARGQDIGRLPSGKEKLQCISINYAPLRSEIELLNRRYWDILMITLQRSIINDIETIEKFTSEATDNLRKQVCFDLAKFLFNSHSVVISFHEIFTLYTYSDFTTFLFISASVR